ncbi:MAG: hypothetical protein HRU19_16850 [Pseudobacteriovorax sp.]|nr:hypothetical protein [Pseudobacteriovorax sp.]
MKSFKGGYLSLFASSSTLVCCALPTLLVSVGLGSAVGVLVTSIPGLVLLSEYKSTVFLISGILTLLSGISWYRSRQTSCPTDPKLRAQCAKSRRWSGVILGLSSSLWLIGFFFAYLAIPMLT